MSPRDSSAQPRIIPPAVITDLKDIHICIYAYIAIFYQPIQKSVVTAAKVCMEINITTRSEMKSIDAY